VRGEVAQIGADDIVVDIGGVGLHIFSTPATAASLRRQQEVTLHTSLVVREDSLTLYGFGETAERDLFELVQTASGVGPKVARAMLSVLSPDQLTAAIAEADTATLTTVPGIGRKGADRIVIELQDRVSKAASPAPVSGSQSRTQALEALPGQGGPTRDAKRALRKSGPKGNSRWPACRLRRYKPYPKPHEPRPESARPRQPGCGARRT